MKENTEMVAAAKTAAAENAADLVAANNERARLMDSARVLPLPIVKVDSVLKSEPNTALAPIAPLRDTLFIRDTIYVKSNTVVMQPAPMVKPVVVMAETKTVEAALPRPTSIYFGLGSTTVGASGKQELNKLSSALKAYPYEYAVSLTGRTDATGSIAVNRRIARQRTQSVSSYLVNKGISSSRITATIQLEQDKTKKADAQSRRVDIEIQGLATN